MNIINSGFTSSSTSSSSKSSNTIYIKRSDCYGEIHYFGIYYHKHEIKIVKHNKVYGIVKNEYQLHKKINKIIKEIEKMKFNTFTLREQE